MTASTKNLFQDMYLAHTHCLVTVKIIGIRRIKRQADRRSFDAHAECPRHTNPSRVLECHQNEREEGAVEEHDRRDDLVPVKSVHQTQTQIIKQLGKRAIKEHDLRYSLLH